MFQVALNRKRSAAIHEAGHAVAALALGVKFTGIAVFVKDENVIVGLQTGQDVVTDMAILYSGMEATALVLGRRIDSYSDRTEIIGILSRNLDLLEEIPQQQLEQETKEISGKILKANFRPLMKIAKKLHRKKYLSYEDCLSLVGDSINPAYIKDKKNPTSYM